MSYFLASNYFGNDKAKTVNVIMDPLSLPKIAQQFFCPLKMHLCIYSFMFTQISWLTFSKYLSANSCSDQTFTRPARRTEHNANPLREKDTRTLCSTQSIKHSFLLYLPTLQTNCWRFILRFMFIQISWIMFRKCTVSWDKADASGLATSSW